MNKKQQLVSELTERVKSAGVILPNDARERPWEIYAGARYWKEFPDGHCRKGVIGHPVSLESNLACLSEDTLTAILADDKITEGCTWNDLWKAWGRAGYFICEPSLVYLPGSKIPTLRMRHDCYLHLFRGYGFQNSRDIMDDGSNGFSGNHLQLVCNLIDPVRRDSIYEGFGGDAEELVEATWKREWAVFRKAMVIAFPFQACWNIAAFDRLLEEKPEMFNEFVNLTDEHGMYQDLNSDIGVREIQAAAWNTTRDPDDTEGLKLTVPMVMTSRSGGAKFLCGILRFYEDAVSLTWSVKGERKFLSLSFPKYEQGVSTERDYYYYIWTSLALVLLKFSGMWFGVYSTELPKKAAWDSVPPVFYNSEECADSLNRMWDFCYNFCSTAYSR